MATFRKVYSIVGVLLLVELALQFYFIAAAALHVWGAANQTEPPTSANVFAGFQAGDTFANLHAFNGSLVIPVTILVLIGLSFGARFPGRIKWQTAALFGLMVIQVFLAGLGFNGSKNSVVGALAGLHGVNALIIVGLSSTLVYRNWAFRAQPTKPMTASETPVATETPAAVETPVGTTV